VTTDFLPRVGPEALPGITSLCSSALSASAPIRALTCDELDRALFSNDQCPVVRFASGTGLVVTVENGDDGYVRLLAVDPTSRRRGYGHRLVEQAEHDLEGATTITVGADPPYFLFPGVPSSETALCYLLERHHYSREEANYNVVVDLSQLPPGPAEASEPRDSDRSQVESWALEHWPNWSAEFLRAFDQGSLLLARDESGISAACAYDVNRSATLGPIASRPELIGKRASRTLLRGAFLKMRDIGYERVEVLWVGPLIPYFEMGGTIGPIFFVYRKRRPRASSPSAQTHGPANTVT
jgi:Acetyltransferase (GNAT) family